MRKYGAIQKCQRAVLAATKLENTLNFARPGQTDKNRYVCSESVARAWCRETMHATAQRATQRPKERHYVAAESQTHRCASGRARKPTFPNHPSSLRPP